MAKVIKEFTDGRVYLPGNDYEGSEKKIAELVAGGHLKVESPKKPARTRTPKE